MSKTLLNRAFGLRDYGYVRTVYKGSKVYFHIEDSRLPGRAHPRRNRMSHINWQQTVKGVVLLAAVAFNVISKKRKS